MNPNYSKALKMRDYLHSTDLEGTANFAVVFESGDVDMWTDQACHASISQQKVLKERRNKEGVARNIYYNGKDNEDKRSHVVTMLQPFYETKKYLETSEKFIDWLINRSPMAKVFVTKSSRIAMSKRGVVLSAKHPANLMQAGLIASRYIMEWSSHVKLWGELTSRGVEENLAFIIANFFTINKDNKVSSYGGFAGHRVFDSSLLDVKAMKNFINNTPEYLTENYATNRSYNGVHRIFREDRPGARDFLYWCKKITATMGHKNVGSSQWDASYVDFTDIDMFVEKTIPSVMEDINNA